MKSLIIAVVASATTVEENQILDSYLKLENLSCPTFVCDEESFEN